MGVTTTTGLNTALDSTPTRARLPGPDVVRAIAMAGVVTMNYHGYLIFQGGREYGGWIYSLFNPWTGPLSTRFAATFVVVAGVGVSLMTNHVGPERAGELSWRFVRRGLLLYGVGLVFDFIWSGTILPYYGAMFVLAAVLWRLPSWLLASIGAAAALAAWWLHHWILTVGHDVSWLTNPGPRSPRGMVFNLFVNGTHPLLPWLAFFCAGMILGRSIDRVRTQLVAFAIGVSLWLISVPLSMAATPNTSLAVTLSSHPFDRGIVYTASALGTGLIAVTGINALANRFADSSVVGALQRAGQMSLTIYLAHALVFNLIVNWLGWISAGPISTSLGFAASYWLIATTLAIAFQRRYGRGPAEWVYRRLTM